MSDKSGREPTCSLTFEHVESEETSMQQRRPALKHVATIECGLGAVLTIGDGLSDTEKKI